MECVVTTVHVTNTTAQTLYKTITKIIITSMGLAFDHARGQGYDGASNISEIEDVLGIIQFFFTTMFASPKCVASFQEKQQDNIQRATEDDVVHNDIFITSEEENDDY
eukprot:15338192-Ditylum_brightwellii.AAC.1